MVEHIDFAQWLKDSIEADQSFVEWRRDFLNRSNTFEALINSFEAENKAMESQARRLFNYGFVDYRFRHITGE